MLSYISIEICWEWQNIPIKNNVLSLRFKTLEQTIINSKLKRMESVVLLTRFREKRRNKGKQWDTIEEADKGY